MCRGSCDPLFYLGGQRSEFRGKQNHQVGVYQSTGVLFKSYQKSVFLCIVVCVCVCVCVCSVCV